MPKGIKDEYIPQDRKMQKESRQWRENDPRDWWRDLITERAPRVWSDTPACEDMGPELFYPAGPGSSPLRAIKVCRTCPVRLECLQYAIDENEDYGVQGGVSEANRKTWTKDGLEAIDMIMLTDKV